MPVSRNPVPFLRRSGLLEAHPRPRPRLDLRALLVHTIPLTNGTTPTLAVLQELEGENPPDRAGTRAWPQQLEENE